MLTLHGQSGFATTHTGNKIRFGDWMVRLEEDGDLDSWHALFMARNPMLQDQLCDLEFQIGHGERPVLTGQAFVWRGDPKSESNRCEATDRLVILTENFPGPSHLVEPDPMTGYVRHEENGIVLRLLYPNPDNPLAIQWEIWDENDTH